MFKTKLFVSPILVITFGIYFFCFSPGKAQAFSIADYNSQLIHNGISWSASADAAFMPSLYLGFAPRVETANQIHFRLGRGNQIRLTAVMDSMTVLTYPYNLKSRYEFIKKSVDLKYIKLQAQNQFLLFENVILSSGVLQLINDFESHLISESEYAKRSIQIIKNLNPNRIFEIQFDIADLAAKWSSSSLNGYIQKMSKEDLKSFALKNPQMTITLINDLVPGRINISSVDTLAIELLSEIVQLSLQKKTESIFIQKVIGLIHSATRSRYDISCIAEANCRLSTLEFTAIYPNGSTIDETTDRIGNRIPRIREVGALTFLDNPARFDVDHIRTENFYGWAPKMDYTPEGNGIHNPAVLTNLSSEAFKNLITDLNIPKNHNRLWIVSRGNVSHGCTRMSSGHILEVRNIFPSSNEEMKKVNYFGNASSDYDLFDIDGSGNSKVMGVEYYLFYGLMSSEGDGYREGKYLIPESLNRIAFYQQLYGKQQFQEVNGDLLFLNPYSSQFHMEKPGQVRAKVFSQQQKGEFKLYEQPYEKDKLQLFTMSGQLMSSLSIGIDDESKGKRLVRIFGRINSCGPFINRFKQCNETNVQNELKVLEPQIIKVK